jgi:hypothetical protein
MATTKNYKSSIEHLDQETLSVDEFIAKLREKLKYPSYHRYMFFAETKTHKCPTMDGAKARHINGGFGGVENKIDAIKFALRTIETLIEDAIGEVSEMCDEHKKEAMLEWANIGEGLGHISTEILNTLCDQAASVTKDSVLKAALASLKLKRSK